jgi:hypothetical protein
VIDERMNTEHGWNDIDRETPKVLGRKPRPSATLSTAYPTFTGLGSNQCLRDEKPAAPRHNRTTVTIEIYREKYNTSKCERHRLSL